MDHYNNGENPKQTCFSGNFFWTYCNILEISNKPSVTQSQNTVTHLHTWITIELSDTNLICVQYDRKNRFQILKAE